MKKYIIGIVISTVTLALDILSKHLVASNLMEGEKIDFLGGFFRITLTYNKGGVFGILQGYKNVFLIISIVVLVVMIGYYIYEKNKSWLFTVSMSLIIGGALGNIIDRMVPGRSGVVDFISIGVDSIYRFFTFNIADSGIVVGAFLLIIVFYLEEMKHKKMADNQ
jgi:signal peptidase II